MQTIDRAIWITTALILAVGLPLAGCAADNDARTNGGDDTDTETLADTESDDDTESEEDTDPGVPRVIAEIVAPAGFDAGCTGPINIHSGWFLSPTTLPSFITRPGDAYGDIDLSEDDSYQHETGGGAIAPGTYYLQVQVLCGHSGPFPQTGQDYIGTTNNPVTFPLTQVMEIGDVDLELIQPDQP